MSSSVVALLSDFGLDDWYVGVMKGVVLSVNSDATVLDVVHTIPRHDVRAASFAVLASYLYLPPDTVMVVVVDPGVGTERKIICARSAGKVFLAPDNGVLTGVLLREGWERLVSVENDEFFIKPVSSTFHGRDIFASVAGHLSLGLGIERLGPDVTRFEEISIPVPRVSDDSLSVTVQWIDAFGNVITNCHEGLVTELVAKWGRALIAGVEIGPIRVVGSYESVGPGEPLGIIGSSGYLEISVREGSARDALGVAIGSEIQLKRA